jgi:hypothetical protein
VQNVIFEPQLGGFGVGCRTDDLAPGVAQPSFGDFGGYLALIATAVSLLITLVLLIARGTLFRVLFGIFFWIAFMGYVQA